MDTTSTASPEAVIAGLTDFTDRRPDIWPGLSRKEYKVYEVGPNWAEVREGSSKSIWARERYDWSTPGRVSWTVMESPFSSTGDSVTVTVEPKGAGSHLHIVWHRRGKTAGSRMFLGALSLFMGSFLKRYVRKTLDGIAEGTLPEPAAPQDRGPEEPPSPS